MNLNGFVIRKSKMVHTVNNVLFAKIGGVGNQFLGNLVTEPYTNWKKAKEVLIFFVICNHLLFK
jgi:hypothetical protein